DFVRHIKFWRHFGSEHDRAALARLRRLFRCGFLFRLYDDPCLRIRAAGLHLPAPAVRGRFPLSWGAHIDQPMVFGGMITLLAMFQMQAGTRDWTANTAAPFLFIFSSIIVLQVPEMLKT